MKKNRVGIVIAVSAVSVFFILLTSFGTMKSGQNELVSPKGAITIPDDINAIFEHSCIGCHNVDSHNKKAKEKLEIDKLTHLSKSKVVAKLGKISEKVGKKEMPPDKFLAKFPDKALTDEQAQRLIEWADQTSDDLIK